MKTEESVADMRRRIDAEHEAGQRALFAPAAVATHQSIVARMAMRTNELIAEHGYERGLALACQALENEEM